MLYHSILLERDLCSAFFKHIVLFVNPTQCLNLTELLNHYGLSPQSTISPKQFTYLCPALLYQIDRRLCIRHNLGHGDSQDKQSPTTGTCTFLDMQYLMSSILLMLLLDVGVTENLGIQYCEHTLFMKTVGAQYNTGITVN